MSGGASGWIPTDPSTCRFDAFISYSQTDREIAYRLQKQLQRTAKPWFRRRSIRVFRDETTLPAGQALWESIVEGLEKSRYLIVIASAAAARSTWVSNEVDWWVRRRGTESIVIVVVDGMIGWNAVSRSFDPLTTCVPSALWTAYAGEPLWVDMRSLEPVGGLEFTSRVASVFAAITGRDKDDVIGEDLRQHARTQRTAAIALVLIASLAVGAGISAWYAVGQRDVAQANEIKAKARALEASSEAGLDANLGNSLLYAAAADNLDPGIRSRGALFRALAENPHLNRFVDQPDRTTAVAWLGSGRKVVSGGRGFVTVTDLESDHDFVMDYRQQPSRFASTGDGSTLVVGADSGDLTVFDVAAADPRWVAAMPGPVAGLAVSPKGNTVAAVTKDADLRVFDLADGSSLGETRLPGSSGAVSYLQFIGDGSRMLVGSVGGEVTTVSADGMGADLLWTSWDAAGDTYSSSAYAGTPDRTWFAWGDTGVLTVDSMQGDGPTPAFARSDFTEPSAIAVSADGTRVAIDDDGQLQVVEAKSTMNTQGSATMLPGTDSVDALLAFSSDGRYLASTGDFGLAIWNLDEGNGIVTTLPTMLPSLSRVDNHTPAVPTDPAGRVLVWSQSQLDRADQHLICWDTTGINQVQTRENWPSLLSVDADRTHMFSNENGLTRWDVVEGCPRSPTHFADLGPRTPFTLTAVAGGSVIVTDQQGLITRFANTGRALQTIPSPEGDVLIPVRQVTASPDGRRLIVGYRSGRLVAYDVENSDLRAVWTVGSGLIPPVAGITYCGRDELAVADGSGSIYLIAASTGTVRIRLDSQVGQVACTSDGSKLVGVAPQNRAYLWDVADGTPLGSFGFLPVTVASDSVASSGRLYSKAGTTLIPDDHNGVWFLLPGSAPTRWDFDDGNWHRMACELAGRDLTAEEWRQAVGSEPTGSFACLPS